jgi:hypothetical protein
MRGGGGEHAQRGHDHCCTRMPPPRRLPSLFGWLEVKIDGDVNVNIGVTHSLLADDDGCQYRHNHTRSHNKKMLLG